MVPQGPVGAAALQQLILSHSGQAKGAAETAPFIFVSK